MIKSIFYMTCHDFPVCRSGQNPGNFIGRDRCYCIFQNKKSMATWNILKDTET